MQSNENTLQQCLLYVAERLQVIKKREYHSQLLNLSHFKGMNTVVDQARQLKLIVQPIHIQSLSSLKNSSYPIIVEFHHALGKQDLNSRGTYTDHCLTDHCLYVLLKFKQHQFYFYNPAGKCVNCYHENEINVLHLKQAWQCFPLYNNLQCDYKNTLSFIYNHFKKDIFLISLLGLFSAAILLFISTMSGFILTHFYDLTQYDLSAMIGCAFAIIVASSGVIYCNDILNKKLSINTLMHLLPSMWYHVLNLPINHFKAYAAGDIVQRVFDFDNTLLNSISCSWSILFNIIVLFLLFAYMIFCDPSLALAYCLLSFTILFVKIMLGRRHIQLSSNKFHLNGELISLLSDIFLQITKVRTAGYEAKAINQWLTKQMDMKHIEKKSCLLEIFLIALDTSLPVILFILLCMVIKQLYSSYHLMLILPFLFCSAQFNVIFEQLAADIIRLIQLMPGFKRMQPLLALQPESLNQKIQHLNSQGHIHIIQATLLAENGDKILDHISMNIKPGSFVGIVGESGAGKSSILKIILGFTAISSGAIFIDGHDIKNLDMQTLRKQFGVVLQTTNILPGTILSNISANITLSLEEAWYLANLVGLDQDIRAMPMQMHTYISDNAGDTISGGQKQKILIARALATKPKILLLDEATSALDNHSQALIYSNLRNLNMTRVVIAHRYSTIVEADMIYVLKKGKILHSGGYQTLLKRDILTTTNV